MLNPEKPYNQLPLLPPKVELETPAVMKQLVKSHRVRPLSKQAREPFN